MEAQPSLSYPWSPSCHVIFIWSIVILGGMNGGDWRCWSKGGVTSSCTNHKYEWKKFCFHKSLSRYVVSLSFVLSLSSVKCLESSSIYYNFMGYIWCSLYFPCWKLSLNDTLHPLLESQMVASRSLKTLVMVSWPQFFFFELSYVRHWLNDSNH